MKFRLLLWYMARRMEMLARTNAEFIAKLHGRDFVIQLSTDAHTQRYFHVHRNRVHSRDAVHPHPDLTLHFRDDDTAFRLVSAADANAFMAAMQEQEVQVSGDYALLMWFMGIGKYLRPARRRRAATRSGSLPTSG